MRFSDRQFENSSVLAHVLAAALAVATFAYRYLSFGHFPNDHFVHLARASGRL